DSAGVIDGGGPDMTRSQGQIAHGANPPPPTRSAAAGQRNEAEQLRRLKARLLQAIESNPLLNQFRKQLLIDITKEGLRIQIVDTQNRPMFANGSARVEPYMRDILREIGKALNDVPNRISLSGHTDSTRYATGDKDYSNWELSADRANASRRELIAGGMDADKIARVQGLASTLNLDKENPADPINRRISIIVLNHQAEAALERENDAATVDAPDQKGAAQIAVQAAAQAEQAPAAAKR
ncbi:MAG: flagellar motor protein MotB, partial [Burkholderiales bacterium]|nr:flagellar motor protein MotB [Burkholderiales bacterium]